MRKALQQMISLLLAIVLTLSVSVASAFAAEVDGDGIIGVGAEPDDGESEVAEVGAESDVAVQIADLTAIADGVRIRWNKSAGVSKVAVLREDRGAWKQIASSADSSYTDKNVSFGNEYRYTVRALSSNGTYTKDGYDEAGVNIRFCATPSLRVDNTVGGVNISWNAVSGAEGYRVFYLNRKGNWAYLADTDNTSFLDTVVNSGGSYTYTVRCISAGGGQYTSYYDTTGKTVKYIAAPELTGTQSTTEGIRISWKASSGAAKYRVFYKNSKGGWSRLGTATGTSLVDDDVRSGKTYTYTVRCMNDDDEYISAYDAEGVKGTYIAAPVVSLSNAPDGVKIRWDAVPGAVNYRIFYYGSKGWTKLTDTTDTSFLDTVVRSGKNYIYTVRCINAEGTAYTGDYYAGKKITFVAAPKITDLTNAPDGVRVTWGAVDGAEKYRVYSYGSSGWTRLTDTTSTSYVDNSAVSDTTCIYTVRCINAAGSAFMSDFRPGVSKRFIAAPDFTLSRNEKSVTVSWDAVKGAQLYRVYYRTDSGWKKRTDTTQTSYEDTNVISGGVYTYTVRCLNAEATGFLSDFREGKTIKFLDMPRVSKLVNGAEGVEISWSAVKGASKYCVYCKNGNGWKRIGTTSSASFVHKDALSGTSYTYTVRCINSSGTEFESGYDTTGKTIYYIAAPRGLKAENYQNSVKISWTPSNGAVKYRVYYYGSKGWTKLTETTASSAIDTEVNSGKSYRYTVRCISADGKSFTSGYHPDGVVCKYIAMPKLKDPDYTRNGVKISWYPSAGAAKYRVYYYGSKGWTKLAETTSDYVVDTDVNSGKNYRYTVRCISADGKSFTSDFDAAGLKVYYVDAPRLQSTNITYAGLTLNWTKPNGATKYRVYKKSGNSWNRLTDTKANSYTDTQVTRGSTYSYTVRVINDAGDRFYSGYDSTGFIITVVIDLAGSFCYYDQTQYDYPYGDGTIGDSGCGPTSFAMIASTLTGKSITPIDAVKWCGNDYYLIGVGTYWSYFSAASDHFGISLVDDYGAYEINSVISELKKGRFVISSQGPGRFTKGGHFIVLAGVTNDGKIIVYDPNGGNHYVGTAFSPSEITDAGTHYWAFDK